MVISRVEALPCAKSFASGLRWPYFQRGFRRNSFLLLVDTLPSGSDSGRHHDLDYFREYEPIKPKARCLGKRMSQDCQP